jgi:hypothetical protein
MPRLRDWLAPSWVVEAEWRLVMVFPAVRDWDWLLRSDTRVEGGMEVADQTPVSRKVVCHTRSGHGTGDGCGRRVDYFLVWRTHIEHFEWN